MKQYEETIEDLQKQREALEHENAQLREEANHQDIHEEDTPLIHHRDFLDRFRHSPTV